MLTIGNEEIRPAHRGELRVLVLPGGSGGLRQVRGYLTADLIRRYAERIKLAPTVVDLSPDGEDELRTACDALNIHPPRYTLAVGFDLDELRGLFTDGAREPVFDVGIRSDDSGRDPVAERLAGLAGRWLTVPAGPDEADGEELELGQEPLSVRLKLLGFDGDAAAELSRWRRRVAEWANSPSGAMSRPHAEALEAAFAGGLDTAASLRVLAGLEADESVGDGVKFETFVAADRLLGLDLARDIGRY